MRRSFVSDERGVATVMVALCMPFILLFCVLSVDVGNWFVHKRHLQNQADAAALAGGGAYTFPVCDNSLITNTALQYSGKGDGTATYNPPADVATSQDRLHAEINSPDYFNQSGNPGEADLSGNPEPCAAKFVDVKMTETDLPWFFRVLGAVDSRVPYINAQARVKLLQVSEAEKLLPVGVQEAAPKRVRAFVVDETTGTPVPGASVELTADGAAGGLQLFSNDTPMTFTVPAGPASPGGTSSLGVRIVLSGNDDSTTCGDPLVECYDSTATTKGLSYIRTWSDQPDPLASGAVPVARSVYLSPGTCGNGSFNSKSTSCTIDVSAKVKWNPSVTLADLDPATSKTKLTAKISGSNTTYPMTYAPATGTWTATAITVPPGTIGRRDITIGWEQQKGTVSTSTCKVNGNPQNCKDTFGALQHTFWNDPRDQASRGGPIAKLDVLDSSTTQQVSDLQRCSSTHTTCTASLIVEVGIKGSLELSAPTDPPVSLRVNGNQTQSLQCDPAEGGSSGLENMLALGCSPRYRLNTGEVCGAKNDVWAQPNPPGWPCVALRTGDPPNATPRGLNRRILCNPALGDAANCDNNASAAVCTQPNKWPLYEPGDPRIVDVFLTPFGSFSGTGLETVPVIRFASFYVTGYTSQGGGVNTPCKDVTGPDADDYSINPPPAGNISGHFIKTVKPNVGGTETDACDFTTLDICAAVLVK